MTQENVAVNGSRRQSPQEIAAALRDRIRTGDLRPGDRLPTQAELAEEFGVERGAVREALRILRAEQLLTNVSRGSPPRVADVTPPREGPQSAMVGLATRLTEAFQAQHVRIDVVCHTAETLTVAVGEQIRLIHGDRMRPKSIDVRILMPSRRISLAFPISVDGGGDDDPVHRRWLEMRNAQGHVLRNNLQALRKSHGVDVHVTFRALPFTPPVKLYLLNGEEALMGYYLLTRREEEYESQTLDMFDALGLESLLFSFENRPGRQGRQGSQRDAAFVEQSQKWFDALWETITTDLSLS